MVVCRIDEIIKLFGLEIVKYCSFLLLNIFEDESLEIEDFFKRFSFLLGGFMWNCLCIILFDVEIFFK